jgi:hypothetical protein
MEKMRSAVPQTVNTRKLMREREAGVSPCPTEELMYKIRVSAYPIVAYYGLY